MGPKTSRGPVVGGDRRREPRWPCDVDIAIMPNSAQGGFVAARVRNFSAHGLALSVIERLRPGEQIVVKFAGEGTAQLLIYTVRSCAPEGVGFRIGAEFAGAITSPNHENEDALRADFVARLEAAASAAPPER